MKRSRIWMHFTSLDSTKAECRICTTKLSCRAGSTNNLHRHMRAVHPTVQVNENRPASLSVAVRAAAAVSATPAPGAPLPLSALRLLVPPLRLVSAAIWQTVQQNAVADYGMLEEFVSTVTDIIPELLTSQQRTKLSLGLRARRGVSVDQSPAGSSLLFQEKSQRHSSPAVLILELCRIEAPTSFEVLQPHLDRMQVLISAWQIEAGGTNIELPQSDFVDLIKSLLNNPEEREHFFQKVFPEQFGPAYNEALHTLMWLFLSRLEKFLPLQSFQQVASMLGETSSVLEDCMQSVSQHEELRTLLQYQKHLSQLDHSDSSLDGACIISALKLPSVERTEMVKTQAQDNILEELLFCTSNVERESLMVVPEEQTRETNADKTDWIPGRLLLLGGATAQEENVDLQHQAADSCAVKKCRIDLRRLDMPLSSQSRPVRANRGLRMKKILQEEKRGVFEEDLPAYQSTSRKTKASSRVSQVVSDNEDSEKESSYMAPISTCSEDDSWSYYSDEDSCHKAANRSPSVADSWSHYSDDESSVVSHGNDSFSSSSTEDPSLRGPRDVSASSRNLSASNVKDGSPKQTRQIRCFICKEPLNTSLRTHMKTHFPAGDYACPRCDSRFKLLTSLKNHLKKTCYEYGQQHVDPEKPDEVKNLYKCDKCQEAFRYKVSLQKHTLTHHELYCNVCRKVLRDAAALARHKVSHTPFQCNRCDKSFTLFKPLLRHYENVHKISRPFKCNRCPKTLSRLRFLIVHEWHHTGHLPFQCARCSLRFKCDADLLYHERVHTREKPYLCAECGKTFAHRSNLLRHLNFIHSESRNERKHSCSQCEKSFKEKGALKKHQRSKHLHELFRNPCPYCGKMVSTSTMKRHKLIHTGERPFKCTVPECDKHYRSASEVKRHILMRHTSERPYKCDVCGKGFVKMCYLNVHAKIHSGEKPFVCHICGKAFPKAYSMLRHKRLLHTFVTH